MVSVDSYRARLIGSGLHLDTRVVTPRAIQILEQTRLGRTTMNLIYKIMDKVRNWFVDRSRESRFDKGFELGRITGRNEAIQMSIHNLYESGYLDFQDNRFKLGFMQAIHHLEKSNNE